MGWLPPAYFDTLYLTYAFVNKKKCANLRFKLAKKKCANLKKKENRDFNLVQAFGSYSKNFEKLKKKKIYIYIYIQKNLLLFLIKKEVNEKKND